MVVKRESQINNGDFWSGFGEQIGQWLVSFTVFNLFI
jgi:hypothetical protein